MAWEGRWHLSMEANCSCRAAAPLAPAPPATPGDAAGKIASQMLWDTGARNGLLWGVVGGGLPGGGGALEQR